MKKSSNGEARVSSIKEQVNELNKQKKALEEDISNLKAELEDKRAEVITEKDISDDKIKEILSKSNDEFIAKQDELKKLQDNIESAKEELESIKNKSIEEKITYDEFLANSNKEKEEAKKAAQEIARGIKKDADDFYEEKKKLANEIIVDAKKDAADRLNDAKAKIEEQKNDLNTKIKAHQKISDDLKKQSSALDERELNLKKREDDLLNRENCVAMKEQEAQAGFPESFKKYREKFEKQLDDLKEKIASETQKLTERKEKVSEEIKKFREDSFSKISKELEEERNKLLKKEDDLNKDKLDLTERLEEAELKKATADIQLQLYKEKIKRLDDEVDEKLKEKYSNLVADKDMIRKHLKEAQERINNLRDENTKMKETLANSKGSDIQKLKDEKEELKKSLEDIRKNNDLIINKLTKFNVDPVTLSDSLYKIQNFNKLQSDYDKLLATYNELRNSNNNLLGNEKELDEQRRRVKSLEDSNEKAYEEIERLKRPKREERLSSLTTYTGFNKNSKLPYFDNISELLWLNNIEKQMTESGIKISKKLLYAFHTSVKIHDWSPLVVLAGVSGTGKSELPRQYAHHGGMNFISVPVKPDWDSMQSLFGYYNSIESKFEPTELSRAIYDMQRNDETKNTMLLILLDEMNLAYVELYFSDLLSKYETNRGTDDIINYELNLGANETPELMEIGKNILWVGTMNEDETTKALSDKVIDRSTLISFPRPKTLVSRNSDIKIPDPKNRLHMKTWLEWCSPEACLSETKIKNTKINIDKYRNIIEEINEKMSKVNRNLGHRVWQSIERYVFSHPLTIKNLGYGDEFVKAFDGAFAEAVAFKVMPKLRGIEVSGDSKKVLNEIGAIIKNDIPVLEDDYNQAMHLSSHIFQWCSAKFMDVIDKED